MITNLKKIRYHKGDLLRVNINVYYANSTFVKTLSRNNVVLLLGEQNYIPEFDELIIGQPFGEIIDIIKVFKKGYRVKEFEGKTIRFIIEVLDYEEAKNIKQSNRLKEIEKYQEGAKLKEAKLLQLQGTLEKKNQYLKDLEETVEKLKKDAAVEKEETVTKTLIVSTEEKEKAKMYALQKFIEHFAVPYSTLISAIEAGGRSENSSVKNYVIGFKMITSQIDEVLKSNGVTKVIPNVGDKFDPNTQKVLELIDDEKLEPETIVSVNSIGFKLHDRLIKTALVSVSKKPGEMKSNISIEDGDDTNNLTTQTPENKKEVITKKEKKDSKEKETSKVKKEVIKKTSDTKKETKTKKIKNDSTKVEKDKKAANKEISKQKEAKPIKKNSVAARAEAAKKAAAKAKEKNKK
ncbi:nucleotide exchange factor GrpE [Mycoplasma sp. Mirounga ES2805-ORL]|uniref:nucleotide exchange factor GrpE n=1 Tax=Mycoplasma sp. Mirounga ES2805-ORL TaxID=754514 RepID=UPI00197C113E|nr:nucleotide exchange factor GrpE [Mycoplasma sp. Mirounga ES2805-ORL]QSF13978.1 nucleotide exchange factor GrpE [Mycoplasma sp. Mirounga ES2805-ORL]